MTRQPLPSARGNFSSRSLGAGPPTRGAGAITSCDSSPVAGSVTLLLPVQACSVFGTAAAFSLVKGFVALANGLLALANGFGAFANGFCAFANGFPPNRRRAILAVSSFNMAPVRASGCVCALLVWRLRALICESAGLSSSSKLRCLLLEVEVDVDVDVDVDVEVEVDVDVEVNHV